MIDATFPLIETARATPAALLNRGACGELRLRFKWDAHRGRTFLAESSQRQPLKVIRAFPQADGACLVHLHNLSGGVLGGDRLSTLVEIDSGGFAQLTTTGATRIYRSRNSNDFAEIENDASVGDSGLLEYVPDQLIPYNGARARQTTTIRLGRDAGLFWWEILAPGREARGELFKFDELQLGLRISSEGQPIVIDRARLCPRQWPLNSPARLSKFRYLSNFYICRTGLGEHRWRELEERLARECESLSMNNDASWGASMLKSDGIIVRALSKGGRDIIAGLQSLWRTAKRDLYGRDAIMPRKVN